MRAICEVEKEIYVPHTEPRTATSVEMTYIGQGLWREESRSSVRSSDWSDTQRTEEDNHVSIYHGDGVRAVLRLRTIRKRQSQTGGGIG